MIRLPNCKFARAKIDGPMQKHASVVHTKIVGTLPLLVLLCRMAILDYHQQLSSDMLCNKLISRRALYPLLVLLVTNLLAGYAQEGPSLKEKLLGSWNSHKVSLSKSQQDTLQLGTYLQFTFTNKKVFISTSPFDRGKWYYVKYGTHSFYLISENKERIVYTVDSLNNQFLRLSTEITGEPDKHIYLSFLNATHPSFIPSVVDTLIEYPIVFTIAPRGLKLNLSRSIISKVKEDAQAPLQFTYHYSIPNDTKNYFPSPHFRHKSFSTWGHFLTTNLNSSLSLLDEISEDQYLCSFAFNPSGNADDQVRILTGDNYVLNNHLYEQLVSSLKYWSHPKGTSNSVPIQFTFLFKKVKD